MTFADVLGLWPFTIDEFVQALHDSVSCRIRLDFLYSSRLAILICLNICAYIYISPSMGCGDSISSINFPFHRIQGCLVRFISEF